MNLSLLWISEVCEIKAVNEVLSQLIVEFI